MSEKRGFRFAWELRQAASRDEAEIMIYSEIVSYKWSERDPEITAQEFDKLLKDAKKSGAKCLRLRINSPGGSVWQAVAMKTMVEMSGFDNITVDIEGLCASAATFFVCLPGARVRIAKGSEFMIHNPRAYAGGTAADFQKHAERLGKMETDQHAMYAQRTGQSEEQIKAWMDGETWFTAEEAVSYGFADEIMTAAQAAACASEESVRLMREIYSRVPEGMLRQKEETQVSPGGENPPSEHTKQNIEEGNQDMEIRDITMEQLREQNPELYESILNQGIAQERTRIQEIEAMTAEGYEDLARTAKESGTSSADFLKQVVAEQGKKRKEFLSNRQEETAPAQNVTGGASSDHDGNGEEQEIQQYAKEMAELAEAYKADRSGGMY